LSSRATGFFSNFTASGWKALGIAFLVGFFVRLVPELLSYPHAIGFDTVYYAWRIGTGVVWYNWSQVFSSWLLYGLLVPVQNFVRGDPFMILKLAAPLLFGLNTCGIYYFARRALNWTERKALFSSLVFSFQIAALAISWEFFRNMLGLGFLLFALAFLEDVGKSVKASLFFVLFSVLVMFSHEFTSIILFIVVLGFVAFTALKETKLTTIRVLGFFAPALAVFLGQVYFVAFPIAYAVPTGNVLIAYQATGHYHGVFGLFTNYLGVFDAVQSYSSYLVLFSHVFSLFVLLFALVLPLVLVGFFRNRLLAFWSGLLLVGGFGAVVVPWFAPDMWSRWMLMLVYPFTFYVANGIGKVWHAGGSGARPIWTRLNWLKISKRVAKSLLVVSSCLGFLFMACPMLYGRFGVVGLPTTVNYVPSSMQSNTLPLIDVDSAVNALKWVNNRMSSSSAFLAQDAFYSWSELCLDSTHTIVYFKNDFHEAIATANAHGFDTLYFIWWNTDIGWYGITTPSSFVQLMSFDRISVYLYVG
jgi:hypothetical protein